ncbi:REPS1 [Branchiostoma lanceolatum]|uniref:REPS1 protein n=1 Tax=Branchiostoma lanceolatum TaxID=7740 RepID=A0A8J9VX78_BRALA|nr:REPS1 [Branchiostoma lanceolatum]
MEGLTLTDAEQKLYSELFGTCDVEHTGRVSGTRASELFLASQLPHDTLQQVGTASLAGLHSLEPATGGAGPSNTPC